ncbi:MAG: HNH endonuclease [Spirochaetales bacterium]|nr:HNH endonuclease [Spirochaetales bacterium]
MMKDQKIIPTRIFGFSRYAITENGEIYSIAQNTFKKRKTAIEPSGYEQVILRDKNGLACKRYVHRLLAESFILKRTLRKGEEIDHLDGNPLNNTISNIEVVSHGENIRRALKNGANKKCAPVNVYDFAGRLIKECRSISEAQKLTNIKPFRIKQIAVKDAPKDSHRGYQFRYPDDIENNPPLNLAMLEWDLKMGDNKETAPF